MGRTHVHFCLSVKGALKNWTRREWKHLADSNDMTPEQAKAQFRIYDFEGKRVIPIGPACEGFSYITGCPGHSIPDELGGENV